MSARCAEVVRRVAPDGAVHEAVLAGAPANVIGTSTCEALVRVAEAAARDEHCCLLVVSGEGDHFSYGASVEEHLPPTAGRMLAGLHAAVRTLALLPVPTVAAVRGRCLGGGFEIALACGIIHAEASARFAAPEIRLGVFAPAATALLEERLPRARAEDLLLTGRELSAEEAERWGLITRLVPAGGLEASIAALAGEMRSRSRLGLRAAVKAMRAQRRDALEERLERLERLYVDELVAVPVGSEGIRAFVEKRKPRWEAAS